MLRNDHKVVERLFKRFEKAGDRAHVEKRQIVDRIVEELSVHAAIEEQVFYPVARATVPGTEEMALESLEEHHVVKWVLSELADMDPTDERFDAKTTVLIENVRHHVEEEEGEFFPTVRSELGRKALTELGEALVAAKKVGADESTSTSPGHSARQYRRNDRRSRRSGGRQHQRHRARGRERGAGSHRPHPRERQAKGVADGVDHRPQTRDWCPQHGVGGGRRCRRDGDSAPVGGEEHSENWASRREEVDVHSKAKRITYGRRRGVAVP